MSEKEEIMEVSEALIILDGIYDLFGKIIIHLDKILLRNQLAAHILRPLKLLIEAYAKKERSLLETYTGLLITKENILGVS